MLSANQLRVGNWVNNNEEDYQITSATIAQLERGDSTAQLIKLTEEWLLRFGFVKFSTGSWCKNLNNDDSYLAIDVKYGNGVWLNINQEGQENTIKLSHIVNVNELQNIYYALTGVELSVSV